MQTYATYACIPMLDCTVTLLLQTKKTFNVIMTFVHTYLLHSDYGGTYVHILHNYVCKIH